MVRLRLSRLADGAPESTVKKLLRNPTGILLGTLHLGAEAALWTRSSFHTHTFNSCGEHVSNSLNIQNVPECAHISIAHN